MNTFTATSGNCAEIERVLVGKNIGVDIAWDRQPSSADMQECDAWLSDQIGQETKSLGIEEDDGRRDRILKQFAANGAIGDPHDN